MKRREDEMKATRTIHVVVTLLLTALVIAPALRAADVPRAVEPHNERPFTRPVVAVPAASDPAGEPKNMPPFTATLAAPAILVPDARFSWTDAGIGAAAMLGVVIAIAGATVLYAPVGRVRRLSS
jgi:hypothetical protein